jgi:hypothetical protein
MDAEKTASKKYRCVIWYVENIRRVWRKIVDAVKAYRRNEREGVAEIFRA